MFVGLEVYMARKNSPASLKPVFTEIRRALKKLRRRRSKASQKDKKILSLKIENLEKLSEKFEQLNDTYLFYFRCRTGRYFMDALRRVAIKLPQRPRSRQR
jgi:hypothetical protein